MRIFMFWFALVSAALTSMATHASELEIILSAPVLPGVDSSVRYISDVDRYHHQRPVLVIHAPLHHQRDWGRYCGRYDACGASVRFVTTYPAQEQRHWQAPAYEVHEYHRPHKKRKKHHHHHHCHH